MISPCSSVAARTLLASDRRVGRALLGSLFLGRSLTRHHVRGKTVRPGRAPVAFPVIGARGNFASPGSSTK